MELCFLKSDALDTLKNSLPQIFENYFIEEDNSWLVKVCGENPFAKFRSVPDFKLAPLDKGLAPGEIDLNNCKILYVNLRFLTPYQAADERFWAGLCHGAFYDYVRRRWGYANESPSTSGDAVKYIKSRFFFGGGTRDSLSTNTLAKCWWTGRALYDSTRSNSFEKLDILGANNFYTKAFSIMTRSFAANPKILNGIIKFVKHFNDRDVKISTENHLRPALSELNKNGGAVVLDCLTEEEIAAIMIEYVEKISAAKSPPALVRKPDRVVEDGDKVYATSLIDGLTKTFKVAKKYTLYSELQGKTVGSVFELRGKQWKITAIKQT